MEPVAFSDPPGPNLAVQDAPHCAAPSPVRMPRVGRGCGCGAGPDAGVDPDAWTDSGHGSGYANTAPRDLKYASHEFSRISPALSYRTRRQSHQTLWMLLLSLCLVLSPVSAVFINFDNCLSDNVQDSAILQFDPKLVSAALDSSYNLNVTVWGNVTGSFTTDKPDYSNPNDTNGKIVDVPYPNGANKETTLFKKLNFLSYEPWDDTSDFCDSLLNAECPLGPVFSNGSLEDILPAISLSTDLGSSYAFTTITATFLIEYGNDAATVIGCISADITPDLGDGIRDCLTYLPVFILAAVAVATIFAAMYCPWGTTDLFRWTSNYGRDADLLRLVTPGFGDCLQYIQFVALTGALTLDYPGFYQPATSTVSWSALMFNSSFVSHGNGTDSLVDGIYFTNGTYGLDQYSQLVGISKDDDIWAGMVIYLLIILVAIVALLQLGFALRWGYRHLSNTQEEDLRAKNIPFSLGTAIRIIFNYFLLPIVALSMFQLVVAPDSPTFTVVLAVAMLVLMIGFMIYLLHLIISTRPRSFLFDDLPTVLLYGPLYNTYSDNAAAFALVPLFTTFMRGVAVGAVQPSGIAQIVILAICEVITILTIHSFRPFHPSTSMNIYHTFFAMIRLTTILLMIAFAPSLGVTEGPKGWIGYAILLLHAVVLVFGFLLNALQTIVEVGARLAGAGGDENGAARGGLVKVFGMRQLSRRLPQREAATSRQSHLSSAAMLDSDERKAAVSPMMNLGRVRSQSASSAGVLLSRHSMGLDTASASPSGRILHHSSGSYTPSTPGEASTFSFLPSAGRSRGASTTVPFEQIPSDPYYRPPRPRRPTIDAFSPNAAKSRDSLAGSDINKKWSQIESGSPEGVTSFEGPSISGRNTPTPAYLGSQAQGSDSQEFRRGTTDYTTREVDFYYGVRGPALNANTPGRKLRTGPVDPTGPAASAAGWFQRFFKGKTKEKGKGFEVVRSSRMPPAMKAATEQNPDGVAAVVDAVRNGPIDSDDDEPIGRAVPYGDDALSEDEDIGDMHRISDIAPTLPGIELGEGIELPSRMPSTNTGTVTRNPSQLDPPEVPRKSSKRKSMIEGSLPTMYDPPQHRPQRSVDSVRLPFERTNSQRRQSTLSTASSLLQFDGQGHSRDTSIGADKDERPVSYGYVPHHRITTSSNDHNLLGSSAEVERSASHSTHESTLGNNRI